MSRPREKKDAFKLLLEHLDFRFERVNGLDSIDPEFKPSSEDVACFKMLLFILQDLEMTEEQLNIVLTTLRQMSLAANFNRRRELYQPLNETIFNLDPINFEEEDEEA